MSLTANTVTTWSPAVSSSDENMVVTNFSSDGTLSTDGTEYLATFRVQFKPTNKGTGYFRITGLTFSPGGNPGPGSFVVLTGVTIPSGAVVVSAYAALDAIFINASSGAGTGAQTCESMLTNGTDVVIVGSVTGLIDPNGF